MAYLVRVYNDGSSEIEETEKSIIHEDYEFKNNPRLVYIKLVFEQDRFIWNSFGKSRQEWYKDLANSKWNIFFKENNLKGIDRL